MKFLNTVCKNFIYLFIYLFTNQIYSQKESNIWLAGANNSGFIIKLDFNLGNADTSVLVSNMRFFIADASICDSAGQLLFYSNGIKIYNSNFDTLSNTTGFNPGWATNFYANSGIGMVQPMVIIPEPNKTNKYLIFHESAENLANGETQPLNLSYSEIDMNLDGGLGGISSRKNIHIIDDTLVLGKVTACRHANGRDWWIISHKYNSDLYYKVLVLPDTIIVNQQQIGSIIPDISDVYGQICFSPDGSKLVFACQNNKIDILGFDRCNGNLSLIETVSTPDSSIGIAGCSISPSNQFLYINNEVNLYQYDLTSSNIELSRYWVATWDSFTAGLQTYFFLNQLAGNNKIYLSTFNGTPYLHVIDQPDQLGAACNFLQHTIKLPFSNIGLPSFPNYNLGSLFASPCDSLHIGINEISEDQKTIDVFPNPARNSLYIRQKDGESIVSLKVFNSIGKQEKIKYSLIRKGEFIEVDVSALSQGIYFLNILTEKQKLFRKFIIQ